MAAYGKRPLWQWILLYVVLGAVVYGVVYYFVFAKKDSPIYNIQGQYPTPQVTTPTSVK